ncbi:hypothetical protein FE394_18475 [Xenorhabdus sp. Reich]|uniref:Uncharacterized protein n=1 Tax=Xenorhabdus littoralis TaxID=2582835 RepID=A0ABU4SRC8_9GAMM|nr:hypothetical protein [Xenorhabdus sp. Reich]MDX8001116.1 hypothetical protein [Xenorhabdus sp. Reich]
MASKNSRSLKERARLRYICALLEADITGHITHRPAMKVYRSYAPAYHPLPAEWYLPRSDRYCFNRYNIHRHAYPRITNVPKAARRHLVIATLLRK